MEGHSSSSSSSNNSHEDLIDVVFSWSKHDIFDQTLYKNQVGKIPDSFGLVQQYLDSFRVPLLEETRAELCSKLQSISSVPYADVISVEETGLNPPCHDKVFSYDVRILWSRHDPSSHRAFIGDIVVITDTKPEKISEFLCFNGTCIFGYITKISWQNEGILVKIKVHDHIQNKDGLPKQYMAFTTNIATNQRIWDSLHSSGDAGILKDLVCTSSTVPGNCDICPPRNSTWIENFGLESLLDDSQYEAVVGSLSKMQCDHKSFVELIWGPPGTGKTRTVSILLWSLLRLNYRTLACAPTNVAITEVASRVLKLLKESSDNEICSLGDVIIFGNMSSTSSEIEEIYLDIRVKKLLKCFGERNGWKRSFASMIDLLEDRELQYNKKGIMGRFKSVVAQFKTCVMVICTHLPKSFIGEHNFKRMVTLMSLIESFERKFLDETAASSMYGKELRTEGLGELRCLQRSLGGLSLPDASNKGFIEDFCFQKASLIFCTASNSYRLHAVEMQPIQLLVIDEAAQLKESESLIPLQISSVRHAILIGDECQLPSMVNSNVSEEAGFGRSLFQRLSILGHEKHLLSKQYRMHPSISFFPRKCFYHNQVVDAPSVQTETYRRIYLPAPMFGPYSFINVSGGREVLDERNSRKNMVEVAVVVRIIQLLFNACNTGNSEKKIGVMIISPYAAQVAEIQNRLGQKYKNNHSLTVKVTSIDGCQGSEEDIVIVSTVRTNRSGSIGFTSNPNRTNVALTRARHCLWVLGNEQTLTNSGSVWEDLVFDAKVRQCFFDADEDKNLGEIIMQVKKELDELGDLLNSDSALFKRARWKVIFSDIFRKSFLKLKSSETKNLVLLFLSKLSTGWRPKRGNVVQYKAISDIVKQHKVGEYYIMVSVDIVKESCYTQVLKVWDILLSQDILKLLKHLDNVFSMYTEDYLYRCKLRCFDGKLEVPVTWPYSTEIVQMKRLGSVERVESSDAPNLDNQIYADRTQVRDSLLLMKFYSLSSGVVSHMLSACDGNMLALPFELTEKEKEVVGFSRSTFVLGRSGTGKTTVLTMKLFQNEQLYHIASEGFHEVKSNPSINAEVASETNVMGNKDVLRQMFLTVSPKLCFAVKRQVSQMKRSVCGGSSSSQSSLIRMEDTTDVELFADIPDSFVRLPPTVYPLVITFQKFLFMLDGTVGRSYFERFSEIRQLNNDRSPNSRSMALETFIRTKEVNFERFLLLYWPHFNSGLTKKLDPSKVFTEIMSVIKGGLQAGTSLDAVLSCNEYVKLSNNRASTLSVEDREAIYDIYLGYEKRKTVNCEFDITDLVIDIHRRLKNSRYAGDEIDFVYIDEVQDLSMRQIALFKYVCRNVDEGFMFCGDTAQTIAKGIEFRFEDIRCLFYNEFLMERKMVDGKRKEKGQISRIFHLRQNFRTHDGILKIAQSIINLIYHFFPSSIDVLSPETTLLRGEAPILLKTKENENIVKALFGNMASSGPEQVILVRDEWSRKEVLVQAGRKALVLTILDCKGLEFEDVLLYNFFSSSPLKKEWRVIYDYMKEKDLLHSTSHTRFNHEKHGGLCSELKQLYVAITRTKQRLWIWEDELSGPVIDYWIKLCLVQVRELDKSFIQEICVASCPEEWKSRGIKLFHEKSYEMAIMCFERAGDLYWQRLAEAYSLRAAADCLLFSDPGMMRNYNIKAAEIFSSIGKHDLAAQCYFEIHEYKRAGNIYMEHFGNSQLEKAAECFTLASCFKHAAEAYARATSYVKCLSACIDGKLFALGFRYTQCWKQTGDASGDKWTKMSKAVQDFYARGAMHYYELNDKRRMMEFITCFNSKESMRTILKDFKCFDELISLECDWGNYLIAADIAKMKGDALLEADLLEKAGLLKEASIVILWFVFSCYLSQLRSNCRTLKPFMQKEENLEKAKSIAKKHSEPFFEFVCAEAVILSKGKTIREVLESALQFVQHCKQSAPLGLERVTKTGHELAVIEQELLDKCARYYFNLKDSEMMMQYVKLFKSIDRRRAFLKSLNCLDELILLEEEQENFLEASCHAEQKGDFLLKSRLLEKAGHFKEASELILFYVLAESLWVSGSNGWPLQGFNQKDELLVKAKSYAKNHSLFFYTSVCMEANVLSNWHSSLFGMSKYLGALERQNHFRGKIITVWRILDAHLNTMPTYYACNDILVNELTNHSEHMLSQNKVSVETLVYFSWYWMSLVSKLINCLGGKEMEDATDYKCHEEFLLNYFGMRKYHGSEDSFYYILNLNANWVRKISSRLLVSKGKLVCIRRHHFFSVALDYWCSEVDRVGVGVLNKLKDLHSYSVQNKYSLSQQSICLVRVVEIVKLIQTSGSLECKRDTCTLKMFQKLSSEQLFCNVFHIEWRNSITDDMVGLRGNKICTDILKASLGNIGVKNEGTSYGKMGKAMTLILGSKKNVFVFDEIMRCFSRNLTWRNLFEKLRDSGDTSNGDLLFYAFKAVLEDTFSVNWRRECDFMSPACFLYLLERLVILVSRRQGHFFTTRSSFVEWMIYEDWCVDSVGGFVIVSDSTSVMHHMYDAIALQVKKLLLSKHDTIQWILMSGLQDFQCPVFVKLVVLLCLICVNSGMHFNTLFEVLNSSDISSELPPEFLDAFQKSWGRYVLDALVEALAVIDNPLVIVSTTNNLSISSFPNAIFFDVKVNKSNKDIRRQLFQSKHESNSSIDDQDKSLKPTFKNQKRCEERSCSVKKYDYFWEILHDLQSLESGTDENLTSNVHRVLVFKVEVDKISNLLSKSFLDEKLSMEADSFLIELKQLAIALEFSDNGLKDSIATIVEISERLWLKRQKLEMFLDQIFLQHSETDEEGSFADTIKSKDN